MLNILIKAAREAGQIHQKYFRKGIETKCKGSFQNILTKADTESQEIVREVILSSMLSKGYKKKEIGFIGEEGLKTQGKFRFVIDPLDGTTNFASGFDHFGVSIALFIDKEIVASVVHHPIHKIFYIAERGKGAYKVLGNSKQRLTIYPEELSKSFVASYLTMKGELREEMLQMLGRLFTRVRSIRVLGTIALDTCLVAENVFNFVIAKTSYIWDIAAGSLVIQQSGGSVVDWKGKKISYDLNNPEKLYPFIAGHPKNLSEILRIL